MFVLFTPLFVSKLCCCCFVGGGGGGDLGGAGAGGGGVVIWLLFGRLAEVVMFEWLC